VNVANEIELFKGGVVPAWAALGPDEGAEEITSDAGSPLGILSIRGKVFRLRYRGEETIVRDPASGEPVSFLDVVLVAGNPNLSKMYYAKAYVEGGDDAPDCMSVNGDAPDPGVPNRQNPTCPDCRWNVWGSKITPQGNKTKACGDSRRIAIVPSNDIPNEAWGGAVLLRVPAASLSPLQQYGDRLKQLGTKFFAVTTRLSFDATKAFPMLAFRPIGGLTQQQYEQVALLRDSDQLKRVLSLPVELTPDARVPQAGASEENGTRPVDPASQQAVPPKPAPVQAAVTPASNQPAAPRPVGFGSPPPRQAGSAGNGAVAGHEGGNGAVSAPAPTKVASKTKATKTASTAQQSPVPAQVELEPDPVNVDETQGAADPGLDDFQGFLAAIDAEVADIT
jgi:hypothetical protein